MASSDAFFTFLSKRQRSTYFISLYWRWIGIQFIILFLVVVFVLPDSLVFYIWKGEPKLLVVLAMIVVFMRHTVGGIVQQMAEAQRQTIRIQRIMLLLSIIHLLAIVVLWATGRLSISLIFIVIGVEWGLVNWIGSRLYEGYKLSENFGAEETDSVASVWQEFLVYCLPFIPFYIVAFISEFSDRWFLQHFGGSAHQGYYAIAMQFGSISQVITASVLKILWKEIAEANERGDAEYIKRLFNRAQRSLFIISVLISGALIPWANEIVSLLLGKEYIDGSIVVVIMLLFPIHLCLGQVCGTLYFALELTKPYTIMNIVQMIIAPILTFFMLAPTNYLIPGLGLASTGLALKMVIVGFVSQNYQMWWLMRKQGWQYSISYQLVSMALFILPAIAILFVINYAFSETLHIILRGVLFGLIYFSFSGLVIYYNSWLIGTSKSELIKYKHRLLNAISW